MKIKELRLLNITIKQNEQILFEGKTEDIPEDLKDKIKKEEYRLYKLIYDRFLASQMADATYNSLTVDFECDKYKFKTTGKSLIFEGYTALYNNQPAEDVSYSYGYQHQDGHYWRLYPDRPTDCPQIRTGRSHSHIETYPGYFLHYLQQERHCTPSTCYPHCRSLRESRENEKRKY